MKARAKIVFLLIISILLVGCTSVEKKLLEASNLVEGGEYEKAIKIYKDLLEKNNDNPGIYIGLANAYRQMGDSNAEELILKEGMTFLEDNKEIYEVLIDLYYINEENYKLLELYEKYKDNIYSEKAIVNVSKIYQSEGEVDLAFEELKKIEIDKVEDIEVLEELLPFYLREDNKEKLKEIVDRGVAINKNGTVVLAYKYLFDKGEDFIIYAVNSADLNNNGTKENIFVIGDKERNFDTGYKKLVAQNGKTGEIIDVVELDNVNMSFNIEFGDFSGEKKLDILLNAHTGGMGVPSTALLYEIKNNRLSQINYSLEDDIEINYLDGFKIELASKQFDRLYSFDIDESAREIYITDGHYTNSGKIINPNLGYGLEEISVYNIEELKKDGLLYRLPYFGNYFAKDFLGTIEVVYVFDGSWKPYDMDIFVEDKPIQYKKYDEKTKVAEVPSMEDTLEETRRILNMTRAQVYEEFGEPFSIDSYQTEYFDYGDKYIFIYNDRVSAIWWLNPTNKFGIKGKLTNQKVKEVFGQPNWEDYNEAGIGEYILNYMIGNLDINFSDLDEDYGGFINIIRR